MLLTLGLAEGTETTGAAIVSIATGALIGWRDFSAMDGGSEDLRALIGADGTALGIKGSSDSVISLLQIDESSTNLSEDNWFDWHDSIEWKDSQWADKSNGGGIGAGLP